MNERNRAESLEPIEKERTDKRYAVVVRMDDASLGCSRRWRLQTEGKLLSSRKLF